MVIHLRNYSHLFKNQLVLVAFIGEYQDSCKNADQQVIDCRCHASHAPVVQQRPQSDAEKKDTAAQAKTEDRPALKRGGFPVHRAPIISQW